MSLKIENLKNIQVSPKKRDGYGRRLLERTGCFRLAKQAHPSADTRKDAQRQDLNQIGRIETYIPVSIFLNTLGQTVAYREFTSAPDIDPLSLSTALDFEADVEIGGEEMEQGRLIIETIDERRQILTENTTEPGIYGIVEFQRPNTNGIYRLVVDLSVSYGVNSTSLSNHYPPYGQSHLYDKVNTGVNSFAQIGRQFVVRHRGDGYYDGVFGHTATLAHRQNGEFVIYEAGGKRDLGIEDLSALPFSIPSENSPFFGENEFYLAGQNQRFGVRNLHRGETWEFPLYLPQAISATQDTAIPSYDGTNIQDAMNAGFQRLN